MQELNDDDWEVNKENLNCNISRETSKEETAEKWDENFKGKENTANLLWKKWNLKMQTVLPGKNYSNTSNTINNKSGFHRKRDSNGSVKDLSSFQ